MKATVANNGERVVLTGNTRDLGHGVQIEVIYQDETKGWEHSEDLIDREEMEATTIAHLTGQMVTILEMIEFSVQQTDIKDYQAEYLMKKINEAKTVNDEIFEVYKKNELDRIKKTYNNEGDENK